MLVEVKSDGRWVQKRMSAWDIEVEHNGRWIILARLNRRNRARTRQKSHKRRRKAAVPNWPRYCMLCHCPRKRTPCVKCGRPTLLHEQMNRVPENEGRRHGHFFLQAGRFESNPRRH